VRCGEVVVLAGGNGAGKSTLLRILATTLLPDAGDATVAGFRLGADGNEVRRRCGTVLGDERAWYWRLSGRVNLEFFGALCGFDPAAARDRAGEILVLLGLEDAADKAVSAYSTGMRLRLALGRALLTAPPILLLDEPTRSVDLQGRRAFHELLLGLARERRASILMATHDLDEAVELADRVVVLAGGRVHGDLARPDRPTLEAALEQA
jgi:ABC-2 type transport system ATP-binding protein